VIGGHCWDLESGVWDLGFFDKLRDSLTRTKEQIVTRFEAIVQQADTEEQRSRPVDVDTIEALEELLISADVGLAATERIVNAVRGRARHGESLRDLVKQEILRVFDTVETARPDGHHPHVTLIVGVNGTGKTTTIGKLANLLKASGKEPLVCAADTFRAAAVEQLEIWAKRANVDIIRAKEGADPAALVFDAIQSGKARGRDPILVDTAGRLHTRVNLMNELDKIRRVASRATEGAPHEVLLVLDATVVRTVFNRRASSPASPASRASFSPNSMARRRAASPLPSRTTSSCRSATSASGKALTT